jgi:hypothetical protein
MTEEKKDSEAKFRQLTELKQTAAEEYQQAMLHRVEEFSQKRESVFNRAFENVLMTSVDLFLNCNPTCFNYFHCNRNKSIILRC